LDWNDIIAKSSAFLDSKGVPDAAVAAELLAARLLNVGRGMLASHLGKEVGERYLDAMRRGLARLAKGEPVQYVLGEWDFRHLTLKCDRRALIPRPETEELVSRVLACLSSRQAGKASGGTAVPLVVDVGTGTGAIILSLANEFKGEAAFLGTDISEDAIVLAKENAVRCGLSDKVKFAVADGLDDFDEPECVDIIVSNPPYIESAACETLDPRIRDFEPRLALDGGISGLDFYDRYLGDALNILKPGGAVFFEIGESQGEAVRSLMSDYGFMDIKVEKDLAGHDRYASGVLA
jgi:release factor glutamine methyltransferase